MRGLGREGRDGKGGLGGGGGGRGGRVAGRGHNELYFLQQSSLIGPRMYFTSMYFMCLERKKKTSRSDSSS